MAAGLHLQRPPPMAAQHGTPAAGMCCLTTFEDITAENYVEYQTVSTPIFLCAAVGS